ncbi:hypothetical protein C8A01DRAFT_15991 [Parachaetomium inaequale]|uniref:Uncharacterized protein n=1 Tax=Parachaetomium inaequale TaxID=2588326 RepID=A0AAN6PFP7_9PEZI|nr:hypothetical protein C8A01DRAFT_15991 [Parachaetomium inaequale]
MLSFTTAALSLLLAVTGVDAGNRAWEPPIHYAKAAIAARDLSGVNNIYFNGTNVSSDHHAHQKRFFGINTPANSQSYPRLWPNGNIDACFEQVDHQHDGQMKSTRAILYDGLIAARELWRQEGLDDNKGFRFNILPDNDAGCQRNLRSTHLLIIYAGQGSTKMATTVGIDQPQAAPESNAPDSMLGPTITLSDSLEVGMENVVANFAHELGHAWGLHHEHQNPKWWHETLSGVDRGDNWFFSEENFHCENLKGFDELMAAYNGQPDYISRPFRNKICRNRGQAGAQQFAGGFNYIPITDEPNTIDDGRNEPDWDSIMLYPSHAGGKIVAGVKQVVLTKRNGDLIQPVFKPSKRDVAGLKKMYGVKSSFLGKILGDTGNSLKNKFDSIRKKDKDSGCSS